jgi:putative tricarboxylic transport membrane protein
MIDRHTTAVLVAATMLVAANGAGAQSYPEKRISLVVGFGAGGMTDVTSRVFGRHMEKTLGIPVIIENKAGAGGTLAINSVGQMPANGYTMVSILADGPFTSAYQGKPINLDNWAILGGYMPQEGVVFAAKNAPFNTFQEMVEYAKKSPVEFGDGASFWSARVGRPTPRSTSCRSPSSPTAPARKPPWP